MTAEARKSLATWTKLPESVIATSRWGNYYAKVGEENIQYWIELMKRQDMLSDEIKASDLIPPVFK